MNGIRAFVACLDAAANAASRPLGDQRLNLADLVDETVLSVAPHRGGYQIRFSSGQRIVVPHGVTLDGAGNPVIEPPALAVSQPGQPAAAPVAVHARGGGPFGELS